MSETSNAGEDPSASEITDNPMLTSSMMLLIYHLMMRFSRTNITMRMGYITLIPQTLTMLLPSWDMLSALHWTPMMPLTPMMSTNSFSHSTMMNYREPMKPLTHLPTSHELWYRIVLTSMLNIWDTDQSTSSEDTEKKKTNLLPLPYGSQCVDTSRPNSPGSMAIAFGKRWQWTRVSPTLEHLGELHVPKSSMAYTPT